MPHIQAEVRRAIAEFLRKSESDVGWNAPLTDAVTDSFMLVDLAVSLQQEFAVRFEHQDLVDVKTPDDLVELVERKRNGGRR
jgi:acyl carrier protein